MRTRTSVNQFAELVRFVTNKHHCDAPRNKDRKVVFEKSLESFISAASINHRSLLPSCRGRCLMAFGFLFMAQINDFAKLNSARCIPIWDRLSTSRYDGMCIKFSFNDSQNARDTIKRCERANFFLIKL